MRDEIGNVPFDLLGGKSVAGDGVGLGGVPVERFDVRGGKSFGKGGIMSNSVGQRAFQNARLKKKQQAETAKLLERAVALVDPQLIWAHVIGHEQIEPAVIIKVGANHPQSAAELAADP